MGMGMWVAAIAWLSATAQDPTAERVRAVLAEHLRDLPEDVRRRYADGLVAAVGTASPAQAARLLDNLDQAVGYHAFEVEYVRERFAGVDLPRTLLQEGYDLEFQYLTQRVLRAARTEWTPASRAAAAGQIDAIAETFRSVLQDRIRGEAGRAWVAAEAEKLRRTWAASLDRPLNRFIDGPLPDEQLAAVRASIARKAAAFPPVEPTAADLGRRERLAELGLLKLVGEVQQACYGATRFAFVELKAPEERCKAWKARVEALHGSERKDAIRSAWERMRAEPEAAPAREARRAAAPAPPETVGAEPGESRRWLLPVLLAALALAGILAVRPLLRSAK